MLNIHAGNARDNSNDTDRAKHQPDSKAYVPNGGPSQLKKAGS